MTRRARPGVCPFQSGVKRSVSSSIGTEPARCRISSNLKCLGRQFRIWQGRHTQYLFEQCLVFGLQHTRLFRDSGSDRSSTLRILSQLATSWAMLLAV